jgi:adenylate kinase family enzyme
MPRRKKESKSNEKPLKSRTFVLGNYDPIVIEHGKKWAAYDKNGRLIILGYSRRICQEYANDRVRQAR